MRQFLRLYAEIHGTLCSNSDTEIIVPNQASFEEPPRTVEGEAFDDEDAGGETECVVCLDGKVDVVLPCGHAFCHECMAEWTRQANTCPLCREESSVDDSWNMFGYPSDQEMRDATLAFIRSL
eukprot:c17097_g1_i1.p2 GENE.c17097_g1_i1~~c17097_g1_i1.p2  ORF type:complete len:123 (+),score=26.17 c17097_g1_i1:302-670(+)